MKMPMDLTEVKLRRKDVFEGKIMTLRLSLKSRSTLLQADSPWGRPTM